MWHGGTNLDRWVGGPWIITSYDYNVPLDEYGCPFEPKYSHLKDLHKILLKYSSSLLNNEPPNPISLGPNQESYVYGNGNESISFLCNIDPVNNATVTFQNKTYFLPRWSVTILGDKKDLYNTATVTALHKDESLASCAPSRSRNNHFATGNSYFYWREVIEPWGGNSVKSPHPLEQIITTHDKSDYLWYFKSFHLDESGPHNLSMESTNDYLHVFVTGEYAGSYMGPSINIPIQLSKGNHILQLLCMTMGLENGGMFQESYSRGIQGTVKIDTIDISDNGSWIMQPGLLGEYLRIYSLEGYNLVRWSPITDSYRNLPLVWYSMRFSLKEEVGWPLALDIGAMGKGFIWFNGHGLGRYWNVIGNSDCSYCNYAGSYDPSKCRVDCGKPSQRYYHVPQDYLTTAGEDNLVIFLEEVGGDPYSVRLVEMGESIACNQVQELPNSQKTSELFIQCDSGTYVRSIDFASFGVPLGSCGSFQIGSCHASESLVCWKSEILFVLVLTPFLLQNIVEKNCPLGSSVCRVPVTSSIFGDPCPNEVHSLAVQVSCA